MNSLNIVSRLTTTPPTSPPRPRTASAGNIHATSDASPRDERPSRASLDFDVLSEKLGLTQDQPEGEGESVQVKREDDVDEKTPLLSGADNTAAFKERPGSGFWSIPRRVAHAILYGVNVVFTTIAAPGRFVVACFYDEEGHFSAIMPIKKFRTLLTRGRRKQTGQPAARPSGSEPADAKTAHPRRTPSRRSPSVDSNASSSSIATSDGEADRALNGPARHTRSKSSVSQSSGDDTAPPKKSIRIKEHNEEVRKRRAGKARKQASAPTDDFTAVANSLKSPSSPTSNTKMTRYPRAPVPPRPLVPRRQPSYTLSYAPETPRKTLIIDLDETLIHSMAKGGRMSTGHMVEVRLGGPVQTPVATSVGGGQAQQQLTLGPGVPILYYVHERPNCHDFLRKVSRWYNLIAFTASVQEYADPVIDWLERERRYFSGRYYRQHCTFRNGAYIKDLAQVEPDLSRVMILDNSPMSYLFHDDNAIPIEGWISDPTDTDLLHLIPLLEALQYVTDVRALLALRKGQAQQA